LEVKKIKQEHEEPPNGSNKANQSPKQVQFDQVFLCHDNLFDKKHLMRQTKRFLIKKKRGKKIGGFLSFKKKSRVKDYISLVHKKHYTKI